LLSDLSKVHANFASPGALGRDWWEPCCRLRTPNDRSLGSFSRDMVYFLSNPALIVSLTEMHRTGRLTSGRLLADRV